MSEDAGNAAGAAHAVAAAPAEDPEVQAASGNRGTRRVLEIAQGVISDLDLDVVLRRVVDAARELSGARYAALGVLDESRTELERFITTGVDEETRERIGAVPRGRGVLGELIEHPTSLRLADVSEHARSYGFPPGHPPMKTFLGVPIVVGGRPFGNLYLTDKANGEQFTAQDEESVELLGKLAAVAIDHARRYSGLASRHSELTQTVAALEATIQIARALGGETDLQAILGLVAKRGRALVEARALVIEYKQEGETVVAAAAGELPEDLVGQRVNLSGTVAEPALRTMTTLRLEDEPNMMRFERHGIGRLGVGARAGLVVPLIFRGREQGVLIALDRLKGGPVFTDDDRRILEAFAASAATAIATAESVEADRQRQRLAAAEQERARWARELHDETLQSLAGLRLGLAAQLRHPDNPGAVIEALRESVEQLDNDIASLRALITDLRPAALDDLGVDAAIEDLGNRARSRGLEVDINMDLAYERDRRSDRLTSELETALYRVIQEALTNAQKHGQARSAALGVDADDTRITVTVRDDGKGFDPAAPSAGFGLMGMRERVELVGGTLDIRSAPGHGTTVQASFPVRRRSERGSGDPAGREGGDRAAKGR